VSHAGPVPERLQKENIVRTAYLILFSVLAVYISLGQTKQGGRGSAALDKEMEGALRGASAEKPCAENTIAHVRVPNGNTMSFCLLPQGKWIFIEAGFFDRQFYLEKIGIKRPQDIPPCALDLYMAVTTPKIPVPKELLDVCPSQYRKRDDYRSREVVKGKFLQDTSKDKYEHHSHYCSATGADALVAKCYHCNPYDDCSDWCVTAKWGWHKRMMSSSSDYDGLGEEGNIAIELNASCGGSTRVRGWDRDDVGDAWGPPDYDFFLANGQSSINGFIYHSTVLFGQDYDFVLRADSNPGAWHRHTGYFFDE
jgi:hypothetical protein